jgi:palmitoyl transferase
MPWPFPNPPRHHLGRSFTATSETLTVRARLSCLVVLMLTCGAMPGMAQQAGASSSDTAESSSPIPPSPTDHGFWWHLGQTTPAGAADPAVPYGNWWKRLWGGYQRTIHDGSFDVFVSGYAWHPPTSYDENQKDNLNEKAWGTGLGRTISDNGTLQNGVYLFVSEDSHNDPQVMWGYSWVARTPSKAGLRLGAGYTFMMIQRDEYGYIPVPFATPLFTLNVGPVQTVLSYVPKYDVWYVFGRITVKGQKVRFASGAR